MRCTLNNLWYVFTVRRYCNLNTIGDIVHCAYYHDGVSYRKKSDRFSVNIDSPNASIVTLAWHREQDTHSWALIAVQQAQFVGMRTAELRCRMGALVTEIW